MQVKYMWINPRTRPLSPVKVAFFVTRYSAFFQTTIALLPPTLSFLTVKVYPLIKALCQPSLSYFNRNAMHYSLLVLVSSTLDLRPLRDLLTKDWSDSFRPHHHHGCSRL